MGAPKPFSPLPLSPQGCGSTAVRAADGLARHRVRPLLTVDDALEATIPEAWHRREPARRPVRDIRAGPPPGECIRTESDARQPS
jgi:hypothetical protein